MTTSCFSTEEAERLRRETPAWGRYAHFAHGSASLPPAAVFAAQHEWIETERQLGSHRAADCHAEALADVKPSVGRLVNAKPYQIALLDSASRSWSTAMSAVLNAGRPVHVITTDLEYGANAIYLLLASKRGALSFTVLSVRTSEVPLLKQISQALDATPLHLTPVVSLPVVSTAWGQEVVHEGISPEIARLVRERDGFFFLDASHAVGQLPVDVEALGCDVLVFPARKWLRGPKGIGVLCLSDRALSRFGAAESTDAAAARWSGSGYAQPHSDARRFEGYEFNPGLRLALKAACDYAMAIGPARIRSQNRDVRSRLTATLTTRLGWAPLETSGSDATALLTFRVPEVERVIGHFVGKLWNLGINVSVVTPQHALWSLASIGAQALLRLTPHYMTGADEIDRLATALAAAGREPDAEQPSVMEPIA